MDNNYNGSNGWWQDENGIWHHQDEQPQQTYYQQQNTFNQQNPYAQQNAYGQQQFYRSNIQPEPAKKPRLPFWLGLLIGIFCTLIIVLIIVAFSGRSEQRPIVRDDNATYNEKVDTIRAYIDKYYVGEVTDEEVEDALAKGLLGGIGDKYAQYWNPEEYAEFIEQESGEYAGIGVSVIWNTDNKCEVYKVYDGSPAQEAGLQVKDLIVAVNGEREFENLDAVVALVRGEAGTEVELTLERDGREIDVVSERRTINVESVSYEMLEEKIGYIKIEQFILNTDEQFNEAVDTLISQGAKSLILDLRDNPGGDYDTVVAMCDRVLPEGVIISVEDSEGVETTEYSDAENCLDIPMVCLINGNSASAAEVFVGAIQDYNMATVIGEQSYGKGVVQSIFSLYDGSGMKFTTERYYTPNGRSLDGVGITPDIEISIPDEAYEDGVVSREEDVQLQKGIEVLTSQQTASSR